MSTFPGIDSIPVIRLIYSLTYLNAHRHRVVYLEREGCIETKERIEKD